MNKKEINEFNRLWKNNVLQCREVLHSRQKDRLFIAEKALEVCEISWGGSSSKNRYTLKRFAADIGLNQKTLGNWVATKVAVHDKLTLQNRKKAKYHELHTLSSKFNKRSSKKEVNEAFEKLHNSSQDERKALDYLSKMKSFYSLLHKKEAAWVLDKKILEEIYFVCSCINKTIRSVNSDLKPKDNNLINSKQSTKRLSVNKALGSKRIVGSYNLNDIEIVSIKEKEQMIFDFMLDEDKWCSPTKIGMVVGHRNRNAASAWSCRSLIKMLELGLVKKNKMGHYKVVKD